ncbi:MAG: acyl-CoA dehydrogenase family protein [Alphaproteobacteria bacterium]|nr:acyl-CoA dehydrogenase family protein [Alphaproteobacteria bacterium]
MDYSLSEQQLAFRDVAEQFARDRISPGYLAREEARAYPMDLLAEMGELGLIAPNLPEKYGGLGCDCQTMGVIIEQIAKGDINMSYALLIGSAVGHMIAAHSENEIAGRVLSKVIAGEELLALGLTEPRGGSDAANLMMKAEKDGNSWLLNGEKTSMSFATQAKHALIFARTSGQADGARGVSALIVPLDAPGISRTAFNDVGTAIVSRGSAIFDNVRIPVENLVGEEGKGFTQVMAGFDFSRAIIGLQCLGAARASLEETWAYSTEREAFDRPIAQFQGLTFPLSEAETFMLGARDICYRTLWLRDNGLPHTTEAAMCKWWAPKLSVDIIHQCLLSHGHGGYTKNLPHQQRLRDVMGLEIGDGTAQVMKLIIAREKAGRVAVQYG